MLSWIVFLPALAAILMLAMPRLPRLKAYVTLVICAIVSAISFFLFARMAGTGKEFLFSLSWPGNGLELSLRFYRFSGFITAAVSVFSLLISLYSMPFFKGKHTSASHYFFPYILLSLSFTAGACLASNLVIMLLFWEALLLTVFGMIILGGNAAFKTAIKAFVIIGITDLCMMAGIGLYGYLSGGLGMMQRLDSSSPLAALAFVLLLIGAISKAGSMPFHTWIPDAALHAPLPFMAFVPAALEKLLGIYFLTRICLDMFIIHPGSWLSPMLMLIGVFTILAAVMMALIQTDYKRLLSYHAISQVGYMILGVGTAVPAGIVGGVFHMINHAMYKSCLFLSAGAVEKSAGTTDLSRLGGLGRKMPVTFIFFFIAAAAISGVPPFNGFFSKELVYDGALERGAFFYIAALAGSFFTAISFLKLGHAAYFGKASSETMQVKEAPLGMLAPMGILAGACVLFGVMNRLPLGFLIQPSLGHAAEGRDFSGFPESWLLVGLTLAVIALAIVYHFWACRKRGGPVEASDVIHHAPLLKGIYRQAEQGAFDPYEAGLKFTNAAAVAGYRVDRCIDWLYEGLAVASARLSAYSIRKAHDGSYRLYLAWSIAGGVLVVLFIMFAGVK